MPELPEVEGVARTLRRSILGGIVTGVSLQRMDMLLLDTQGEPLRAAIRRRRAGTRSDSPAIRSSSAPRTEGAMLHGGRVKAIHRQGKQCAIEVDDGRVLVVHLGMSGRLQLLRPRDPMAPHTHAVWTISTGDQTNELRFVDPRRFGGLCAIASLTDLRERIWSHLGPDALTLSGKALAQACSARHRPIKALLLDQACVAGIGNIYADEILHAAGIHPLEPANRLVAQATLIARLTRSILADAVRLGGSTIRDYIDPAGQGGSYQQRHRVYGRLNEACRGRNGRPCTARIEAVTVAGRTSWFCPRCQKLSTGHSRPVEKSIRSPVKARSRASGRSL
ncbi:MAG: bifunctional DNA-formamidopyrimidine glycosylase/DNA-(apurinic or apyrimidinic site) lyase [Phycisphaeraceae bacterium]|nr:bifunctional DNA-formamidopyrimidine glycosylase/DNA-(apurinic or apyrimidinic site) lyase [Phycisphaeraceae bacterium]